MTLAAIPIGTVATIVIIVILFVWLGILFYDGDSNWFD